ncbi:MAG TPA: cupin domain-containing protein [Bryobacteraceae bacterium]|nr:cupin domain-containing protein [Bryobacteraceae bacterium]
MTEYLSRLLSPLTAESFLQHYQARESFHVSRSSPGYYADLLSVADLDTILQSCQLPAAFMNVVKGGVRCPIEEWSRFATSARGMHQIAIPESILNLYADGATLIVNQADALLPALADTCRKLTGELGFPTQTNIYITPRHATGFSKHSDDHDVLILQIAGSKSWRVYASDAVETELRSGDLLYVPRGTFHDARSCEEDSIHITLGLRPAYAFELIRDLATVAAEREDFQRPMPPRFAGADALRSFQTEFLSRLQALAKEADFATLAEIRSRDHARREADAWPGRFADLRLLSLMTPETVVCRRAEVPAEITSDGKFVHVSFGDRKVSIPVFMREQLPRLLGDQEFVVRDIEGMITGSGKVTLVQELVKAGFLRIVSI